MLRRVYKCFLVSNLYLKVHLSILEHEKNEIKSKIKTARTIPYGWSEHSPWQINQGTLQAI